LTPRFTEDAQALWRAANRATDIGEDGRVYASQYRYYRLPPVGFANDMNEPALPTIRYQMGFIDPIADMLVLGSNRFSAGGNGLVAVCTGEYRYG
jgi:hypothetical protein